MNPRVCLAPTIAVLAALVVACSDGNNNGPAPAPAANVANIDVVLTAAQRTVFSGSPGAADATLTIDLDTGAITGTVDLLNIDATAVVLAEGFAGDAVGDLMDLEQQDATTWVFAADSTLDVAALELLRRGALYLRVDSADGGLRGQLLMDGVRLIITFINGAEQVPAVASNGGGYAFVTLDEAAGLAQVHIRAFGLDAANPIVAAHVHEALAGLNGPIVVDDFVEDPNDNGHWFHVDVALDPALLDALAKGRLYVNTHTPDNPPGELRGQIVVAGVVEGVFTELGGGQVVNLQPLVAIPGASATAASTITSDPQAMSVVVNTRDLDTNAAMVAVHQAPAGQNGPVAFALTQDMDFLARHTVLDMPLSADQYAALRNQLLYLRLENLDGEIRGQILPAGSMPPSEEAFVVTATDPANAAMVPVLPPAITVTFSADPLPSTTVDAVRFERSGGDGSFGDGNETVIEPGSVDVAGDLLTLDVAAVASIDDVYRVLVGDSVTDTAGKPLDGDGDGNAGGDFELTFTVMDEAPSFTFIQEQIFTPSCAVAGCHDAATSQNDMDLSAGAAFANIVNVPTFDTSDFDRIEPGDPERSYILKKVRGDPDIVGSQMPLIGGPLDPALIEALSEWIADGAREN
jgi:hypothetical protein